MATKKKAEVDYDSLPESDPFEMHRDELVIELTDKDIPKTTRGRKSEGPNIYEQKVEQFMNQEEPSRYIQFSGRKPLTVASGLRKAIEQKGLHGTVTVVTRGEELWLARK